MPDNPYDPIITNVVSNLTSRINQMCIELEEGSLDPEAKVLINKIVELQTELLLLKMAGAEKSETELIEAALASAAQSLTAAASINAVAAAKKAWRGFLIDTISTVVKII